MAINFPNSPVDGNTYDYEGVRFTYVAAGGGYWKVNTPGSVGIANSTEIDAGVEANKYITPSGLASSKYAGAAGISNNNTGSTLSATDIQSAIDELDAKIEALP